MHRASRQSRGFHVIPAKNDVLRGISQTASLLQQKKLQICENCRHALHEIAGYVWEDGGGREKPRKVHDHAMDDMRYFAATVAAENDAPDVISFSVERGTF
ncbi:hypothetical protein LJC32_04890 [Oscillospiraceae bacterium OttesenSCG-928-F05]|nr:hypothetical protein [Oscillospiraceae bacterium OttesenSCG-928-F05]